MAAPVPFPCHHFWPPLLRGVAISYPPLVPVLPRYQTARPFDDPPIPLSTLLSRRVQGFFRSNRFASSVPRR